MNKKPLTFEHTRGTKTYHLPFGKAEHPRLTIMVRRMADGTFHAGMSVCGVGDLFTRHSGRARAFHRMNGIPITAPDAIALFSTLEKSLKELDDRRPGTVPDKVKWDLMELCASLNDAFDKLESNRLSKSMGDVAEVVLERPVDIEIELPTEDGYEAGGC